MITSQEKETANMKTHSSPEGIASSEKLFYSKAGQEMLKSSSDDVIYRGSSLQKTPVMFHSAIDIRDKNISRRDAKILELMMKR